MIWTHGWSSRHCDILRLKGEGQKLACAVGSNGPVMEQKKSIDTRIRFLLEWYLGIPEEKISFTSWTLHRVQVFFVYNKIVRADSSESRYRLRNLPRYFSRWIFYFFIFISTKSLKNYSKSQKKHKLEKSIFWLYISRSMYWTYYMV
jgi:hypothetical protein